MRHAPYTPVAVLPVAPFFMAFHDDNRLVTCDKVGGVRVWDVWRSRMLDQALAGGGAYGDAYYDSRRRYFWDATTLLAITGDQGAVQVWPGREPLVRRAPLGMFGVGPLLDASPAWGRLVGVRYHPSQPDSLTTGVVGQAAPTAALIEQPFSPARADTLRLAPGDGATVIEISNRRLVDVRDFETLAVVKAFPPRVWVVTMDDHFLITLPSESDASGGFHLDLRDYRTGDVRYALPVRYPSGYTNVRVSPDGKVVVVANKMSAGGPGWSGFYDVPGGRLLAEYERGWQDVSFLRDSKRFFCFDPPTGKHAIFEIGRAWPLAVLPDVESDGVCPVAESPNGSLMACGGPAVVRGTTVLRRTGWDCPGSPLGALAFPHVWLFSATFAGAAWSLRRDSTTKSDPAIPCRSNRWARPVVGAGAVALLLLTLHAVLGLGVGQTAPKTAAPLLLVCWIGLGTGSRFWRMATLVSSVLALAWCAQCLAAVWRVGLIAPVALEILDRSYVSPPVVPLAALVAAAVACAAVTGWMAKALRPPRLDSDGVIGGA